MKNKNHKFSVNQLLNIVDAARGAKGCAKATRFVNQLDEYDSNVNHIESFKSPSGGDAIKLARAGLRVVRLLK